MLCPSLNFVGDKNNFVFVDFRAIFQAVKLRVRWQSCVPHPPMMLQVEPAPSRMSSVFLQVLPKAILSKSLICHFIFLL